MNPKFQHPWNITEVMAKQLQEKLSSQVIKTNQLSTIRYIAGTDVSYKKNSDKVIAAIVILNAETLDFVESVSICQ